MCVLDDLEHVVVVEVLQVVDTTHLQEHINRSFLSDVKVDNAVNESFLGI